MARYDHRDNSTRRQQPYGNASHTGESKEERESIPLPHAVSLLILKGINNSSRFSDIPSDVSFDDSIDAKRSVSAHKVILSAASPFFYKMFQGNWKERDLKRLPIPGDFRFEVFQAVISFLYEEQVEIEEDSLLELYKAAHYLQMDNLKDAIAAALKTWSLSSKGLIVRLCELVRSDNEAENREMKDDTLYQACLQYLVKNIAHLASTATFEDLSCKTIEDLLDSEDITIDEIDLLKFLKQWVERHVNVHDSSSSLKIEEVQTLFSKIRYGTIPYHLLIMEVTSIPFASGTQFGKVIKLHNFNFDPIFVGKNLKLFTNRREQNPVFVFFPLTCKHETRMMRHMASDKVHISKGGTFVTIHAGHGNPTFNIKPGSEGWSQELQFNMKVFRFFENQTMEIVFTFKSTMKMRDMHRYHDAMLQCINFKPASSCVTSEAVYKPQFAEILPNFCERRWNLDFEAPYLLVVSWRHTNELTISQGSGT